MRHAGVIGALMAGSLLQGCSGDIDEPTSVEAERAGVIPNTYRYTVPPGFEMIVNSTVVTGDPTVYLKMQSDCNLVLYSHGAALWHTHTAGRGSNCRAKMQTDGNFVLSNPVTPIWWSGTQGHPGARLVLNDYNVKLLVTLDDYSWYKFLYGHWA